MKPQSAKSKGRRAQQEVRDIYRIALPILQEDDLTSRSMGASGTDLILSPAAKQLIPFDHEIKNVESLNIWEALRQAEANTATGRWPLVVFRRNRTPLYAALRFSDLASMLWMWRQAEGKAYAKIES